MTVIALLDANALYRATTRSVLLYLAVAGVYRARWSEAIQDEWVSAVLRNGPQIDPARIQRTRSLMDSHIPDASVSGYEPLIAGLALPDANDRHVLAAAIHGGASFIVTDNLRHFPGTALAPYQLMACTADRFVLGLLAGDGITVATAIGRDRANLRNPPMDVASYLGALVSSGLVETAAALRDFTDHL